MKNLISANIVIWSYRAEPPKKGQHKTEMQMSLILLTFGVMFQSLFLVIKYHGWKH